MRSLLFFVLVLSAWPTRVLCLVCPAGSYLYLHERVSTGVGSGVELCEYCPAGRYGNVSGLTSASCTSACPGGYYCASGTVTPTETPCGSSKTYCPQGSQIRRKVASGFYSVGGTSASTRSAQLECPAGSYCVDGVRRPCPSGRFGSIDGLSSPACSGPCAAGFFCEANSTAPLKCTPGSYCPGLGRRVLCPSGRWGASSGLASDLCDGECNRTFWCGEGSTTATQHACPPGKFGKTTGLTTSECSGSCKPGFYCPTGSVSEFETPCGGNSMYCPGDTGAPIRVSTGYYSIGNDANTRSAQTISEAGYYAVSGVRKPCPGGRYGRQQGLADWPCNGPCASDLYALERGNWGFAPGHYCPENSTSAKQYQCPAGRHGQVDAAAFYGHATAACAGPCAKRHYCPVGSVSATEVKCPGGRFGAITGLSTPACTAHRDGVCNARTNTCVEEPSECAAGYYCPAGSASAHEHECGSAALYCPAGVAAPLPVAAGNYSTGGTNAHTRTKQTPCPKGSYCVDGIPRRCPAGRYGSTTGLSTADCSGLCSAGYFCGPIAGSTSATQEACPGGTYSTTKGLSSQEGCSECAAGRYCPPGSTASLECGSAAVYCPARSAVAVRVRAGYYTAPEGGAAPAEADAAKRAAQRECEPGYYCAGGVRVACPAGRFGGDVGLRDAACSGVCGVGHYCPLGSSSPFEHPCPAGRYGGELGLGNSSCSGKCHTHDGSREGKACPPGSIYPYLEE